MTPDSRVRRKFQIVAATTGATGVAVVGYVLISRPAADLSALLLVTGLALFLATMISFVASRAW
jgi:hypothetical protein